jgi:hypothetical protein
MSDTLFIPGDLDIRGSLKVRGTLPTIPRTSLQENPLQPFGLPFENWRVWDAYASLLGTAANDDLGFQAGTYGSFCPHVTAGDVKALGAVSRKARTTFTVPQNYEAGASIQITLWAGILGAVADTSCTLDVSAYLVGPDVAVLGTDLVTTAAQNINSLSVVDFDFVLTTATIDPGSVLDILVTIAANDAATGSAVGPAISRASVGVDVRG